MRTEQIEQPVKDNRISTRVTGEHKALFEQAATLKGLSLTDFMISSAYEAAVKVLEDSQIVLELGPADTRAFAKRILNPRDPSELPSLQVAVRRYQDTRD